MAEDAVKRMPESEYSDPGFWLLNSRVDVLERENRKLERALLIAAGMLSTHPNWATWHPEAIVEMLTGDDRRG